MNRRGLFGPLIILVLLFMLVWIWILLLPIFTPIISTTITSTSGGAHADGVEFFLRMLPWAVPLIIVLGFIWLMVRQ